MTTPPEPDEPTPSGQPHEGAHSPVPETDAASDEVAALGYEQARDELIRIVATLEGGRVGLEESMTLWQRGEALAARCTEWLDAAEAALPAAAPAQPEQARS